jgi:twinkle protein
MDAQEIRNRLNGQMLAFLGYLLPNGKKKGNEWCVGDLTGSAGESLKIVVSGQKAGLWAEFGGHEKGGVFDLIMAVRGCSFRDALDEARKFLGVTSVKPAVERPKPKGFAKDKLKQLTKTTAIKYANDERGIRDETLKLYRVRAHERQSQWNTDFVAFQFFTPSGDAAFLKSTGIKKTDAGKKDIWSTEPYYTLWGWWLVTQQHRAIIVTEGEWDAMSVAQMDAPHPVLSLPAGASNMTWIDNDYDALLQFEAIYLCFDNDEAGDKGAEEAAKRLGRARCFRIRVPAPYKDANEALMSGDEKATEVSEWMKGAKTFDPPTIQSASAYKDGVVARSQRYHSVEQQPDFFIRGVPWDFRNGESTVLTGYPFHGKSSWFYQAMVAEMNKGERVCVASFEIPARDMLFEMIRIKMGRPPKPEEVPHHIDWFADKLWFIEASDDHKIRAKELFDDYSYALKRFNCSRFVTDSLMFLVDKEDWGGQEEVAKIGARFSVRNDCHHVLIAHADAKNGKGEDIVPEGFHVLGGQGIMGAAHNGISIWRNKAKERAIQEGDMDAMKKAGEHDAIMYLFKNRIGQKICFRKLKFSPISCTYSSFE